MDDFLLKLKRIVTTLPKKQKAIATYILKNPAEAKSINLKELCQICDTTEPVVFALCRKLEVASFSELKTNLTLSIGAKFATISDPITSNISDDDLFNIRDSKQRLDSLAHHYRESISDTLAGFNIKEYELATKLLKKANKILLIGVGVSGNAGHLMLQAFIRTGLQANWTSDPNLFITYLAQMESNDICLVLSQTGRQKDILFAVETAKALKVKTILISSNPHESIKENADVYLPTGPSPINAKTHVSIVSKLALPVLFMLDSLAISLMVDTKSKLIKTADTTAVHNNKRLL